MRSLLPSAPRECSTGPCGSHGSERKESLPVASSPTAPICWAARSASRSALARLLALTGRTWGPRCGARAPDPWMLPSGLAVAVVVPSSAW